MAATVESGTAPGRGQPESTSQPGPDELLAETGGWHGPWVAS
jgi:hypothetical protein